MNHLDDSDLRTHFLGESEGLGAPGVHTHVFSDLILEEETGVHARPGERRAMLQTLTTIGVSLMVHALAITGLWSNSELPRTSIDSNAIDREKRDQEIRIGLVQRNPFRDTIAQDSAPANEDAETDSALAFDAPEPSIPLATTEVDLMLTSPAEERPNAPSAMTETAERGSSHDILVRRDKEDSTPTLIAPSAAAISALLTARGREREAKELSRDCTAAQMRSELITCEERGDAGTPPLAFDAVRSNPFARALSPLNVRDRSERSVAVIARQASAVSSRLDASELPTGTISYVTEEIEAAISLGSGQGNRAATQMKRMVDKSEASAMAERILSDPWLQNAAREIQARKAIK